MNPIIKFKYAVIVLLMMVINGVGAWASTPWTVNPSDYRYDMSLYLDVYFVAGKMDYVQYDVAVFCGDECRGVAEPLSLTDGSQCLYLRARSNKESGEKMSFKYYNKQTQEVSDIEGVSFDFVSNGRLGYPSDPYKVKIVRHFDVNLSAGAGGSIDVQGGRIAEGTELTITAAPAEGYHFLQWSDGTTDNPRTVVVDNNITLDAEFEVNIYKLTYKVDGNIYKTFDISYATELTAEAYPQKEGYTFSGWEGLPETMPAHDVTVSGTFSINSYNAVFKIGDEVIESKEIVYGQPVTAPEAPAKEGHTFAGWQDVPATMPAHDIEILGSYTVNSYKLTYVIDNETYKEVEVDYGATIESEEPQKEGYTFSGWEGMPETMPAHDVTVSGTFSINSYRLTLYLNDEIYHTEELEYGSPILVEEPTVPEGMKFDGWIDDIPETMPAHDVDIHGTYSEMSYVLSVLIDRDSIVTVCDLKGYVLYGNVKWHEVAPLLANGFYIINGQKYLINR